MLFRSPPTLTISSPGNHTIIFTAISTVSGTSTDNLGGSGVSSVTWKVDSGSISTASGITPWSFTTPALSLGDHNIQINATDLAGLVTSKILVITYAAPEATLPPPSGTGSITFTAKSGGGFTSLSSIPAGSLPTPPPPGSYPIGFF